MFKDFPAKLGKILFLLTTPLHIIIGIKEEKEWHYGENF